jgi:hypothetical protein
VPELQPDQPPPPDYYAANVRRMLSHVLDCHQDLLRPDERRYARSLLSASVAAQRFFARLVTRKGPWLRLDKLGYAEVADREAAVAELCDLGVIACGARAPADELLCLLTTPERHALFPGIPRQRRDDWITTCVTTHTDEQIRRIISRSYTWLELTAPSRFAVCQLLYFGDGHQDMSTFVLQDLGMTRYPQYSLEPQDRMFAEQKDLERFRALRHLRALAQRLVEHPELDVWLSDQLWYSHPARERRVRVLHKLGEDAGVEALLSKMRQRPEASEEQEFAQWFGSRRKASGEITTLSLEGSTPPDIEAHAARLLAAAGGEAWHLENQLPMMLAGLAYWDIVFAPLPGAFVNPFQVAPLDLFWPDFAKTRADLLARRDEAFAEPGRFTATLLEHHKQHHGLANRLVNWHAWPAERLELLIRHVPEPDLKQIARYVIQQPYRAKTGFPDLLVIYGNGSYEFVEVKGPTDALQPAQRIWLQVLGDIGSPARVLKFKP